MFEIFTFTQPLSPPRLCCFPTAMRPRQTLPACGLTFTTHTHTTVQEGSRGECVVLAVDSGIQLGASAVHSQHFPSTRRVNKVPLPLIDSSTFPAQAPRLCRFSLGYMGLKAAAEQFPPSILARSAGANRRFRPVRGPNMFTLARRWAGGRLVRKEAMPPAIPPWRSAKCWLFQYSWLLDGCNLKFACLWSGIIPHGVSVHHVGDFAMQRVELSRNLAQPSCQAPDWSVWKIILVSYQLWQKQEAAFASCPEKITEADKEDIKASLTAAKEISGGFIRRFYQNKGEQRVALFFADSMLSLCLMPPLRTSRNNWAVANWLSWWYQILIGPFWLC